MRLQELAGIIIHYDEILTMSAKMGAATGNLEWEERYRKYEPLLDATIKETIELSPEIFMSEAATETDASNIELVAMENQAFDLIRQEQHEAAMAILFSKEYEMHKAIYSKGMEGINSTIQERINSALKAQRQRAFLIVSFAVVTLTILLLAWFGIVRLVGIYVAERKKTEEALKKAHNELEKKVEDRTANLQLSNEQLKQEITQRKETEKQLRESEERYQRLIETANDAIFIVDADTGIILNANKRAGELLGIPPEEIIGMHQTQLHSKEDEEYYRKIFLDHVQRLDGVILGDVFVWHRNGYKIPVEISASVTNLSGKNIIQGIFRDITDRKRAEEAVRKSEEKYHNLIEHANDAIISINREGIIIGFNKKAEKMFGYPREEMLGKPSDLLILQQYRENQEKKILGKFAEAGTGLYMENKISEGKGLRKDGKEFNIEFSYYIVDIHGELIATAIIRDISERKEAEEKLLHNQEQLRSLASQLTKVEEQERRNIASYLHDHLGQELFAMKLHLEQLKKPSPSNHTIKTLESAIERINQMMSDMRSMSYELSPPILYELGLEAALEWIVEEMRTLLAITITFNDDGQVKPLAETTIVLLFQAVRELLNNVTRHAKAQNVEVFVARDNGMVVIQVNDDGIGFEGSAVDPSKEKTQGFGLYSIKERLKYIGGDLDIESARNRGARIRLQAPIKS
jgi:PAS domain S-box-containing protein